MAELRIVIVEGAGAGREFAVAETVVLGRDPDSAIPLDDPEASRQHASITARGQGAVVDDLGSTNGTLVNDVRIEGPREIGPGDRIRIGTTVLELQGVAAAVQEPAAAGAPGPEAAAPPRPPAPEQPSPATGPPVTYGQRSDDYPIQVHAQYPEGGIARWRALVQWWLLPIPHFFVLIFVVIAADLAILVAFFAIIVTRRYPRGIFDFLAGTGRWLVRVSGYFYFMTESYPPFSFGEEPGYPVVARFDYPEDGVARWRPIVHWLLAIPHYIVLYVLGAVAFVCHIIAGFAILFTGRYPHSLFDLILGFVRWQTRVNAYSIWMTERYPPFTLSS
jgi:hypothetical protein